MQMSALGQKQTFALQKAMSASPLIATVKADLVDRPCPLYSWKRTCAVHQPMSTMGHKRTSPQNFRTQSGVTTMAMERAFVPLTSMINGSVVSSNFTLLRMPSQPVAPLNAPDFTSCPP